MKLIKKYENTFQQITFLIRSIVAKKFVAKKFVAKKSVAKKSVAIVRRKFVFNVFSIVIASTIFIITQSFVVVIFKKFFTILNANRFSFKNFFLTFSIFSPFVVADFLILYRKFFAIFLISSLVVVADSLIFRRFARLQK